MTEPVILDESDIDKIIVDETVSVDWTETAERRDWVTEIFGGILEPVRVGPNLDCCEFDYYCEIRGAENALMQRLTDWCNIAMEAAESF